jgi:hypothetical protein
MRNDATTFPPRRDCMNIMKNITAPLIILSFTLAAGFFCGGCKGTLGTDTVNVSGSVMSGGKIIGGSLTVSSNTISVGGSLAQARRVCLDCTGAGIGLGDYLVKEFGEWNPSQHKFGKIELCAFSNSLKVDIFSKLRMAFERKLLRVPVSRTIREDLHLINRVTSPNGQITYRAAHSPDGHADRCTALALAVRAGSDVRKPAAMESVRTGAGVGILGMGRVDGVVWM